MIRVSLFPNGALDRHPRPTTWTLAELAGRLSAFDVRPDVTDKSRLPAWSAVTYLHGATRAAANVASVSALVLDIDDGTPLDVVWASWPAHARVLYTSWSHRPGAPRCRLVVPFARPVPAEMWGRVWTWAAITARRRGVVVDRSCSDPSRLWFLPAVASHDVDREARTELRLPLYEAAWEDLPDPLAAQAAVRRARAPLLAPAGYTPPTVERARDPQFREDVAREIGATLAGAGENRRADRIPCPACTRRSVVFYLAPSRAFGAWCSHQRTCGWRGSLASLRH